MERSVDYPVCLRMYETAAAKTSFLMFFMKQMRGYRVSEASSIFQFSHPSINWLYC